MDTTVDYYEVLGVPVTAERPEIKAAWSKLVQRFHPDMGEEADATKFMDVQQAFDILGDEEKRVQYDGARAAQRASAVAAPPAPEPSTVPGWGEAAPQTPPRRDHANWQPPHLRDDSYSSQPEPPKPQVRPEPAPTKDLHPATQPGWRIQADPASDVKVTKNWVSLWAPVLGLGGAGALCGLLAEQFETPGLLGAVTSILVGLLFVAIAIGGLMDLSKAKAGKSGTLAAVLTTLVTVLSVLVSLNTGNFWLFGSSILMLAAAAALTLALKYRYITTRQMSVKQLKEYTVFGRPGKHAPVQLLQLVEKDLADKLADLAMIPSLRMYHGVGVPATAQEVQAGEAQRTKFGATVLIGGHMGQAVTAGKKVAMLSSAVWFPGNYTCDNYGGVLVNGEHTQFSIDPYMDEYKHWALKLKGKADLRLLVVVHADGPVSFDMPNLPIEFVAADQVTDTLGSWMVDDQAHLDREVNALIAEHLESA